MEALLGVFVGALLAHFFSEQRTRKSRQVERKALATMLLVEMRTLEVNLRRMFGDLEAAHWRGTLSSPAFDGVGHRLFLFSANTMQEILWFHSMIRDARLIMDDYWRMREDKSIDIGQHHWHTRMRCYHALAGMPEVRAALEGEGGSIPQPPTGVFKETEHPELPQIPERVFEEFLVNPKSGEG